MSEYKGLIAVNIGDSQAKDSSSVERTSYGTNIWNNCISSEFPIIGTKMEDGIAICEIGQPHFGYTMQARVDMYSSLNGDAKIYTSNGQLCAELYYVKGEETGECKLYYDSGELYFDGYLEKGYRNGRGIEYSKSGAIIFDGFYKDGRRNPKIRRNEKHRKYWNDIDDSGQISCICKKNYRGLNDGTCYFYEDGNIKSISKWKDGEEIETINEFDGDQMTTFRNGKLVYSGGYAKLTDFKYVPTAGRRMKIHFMYRWFHWMLWLSRLSLLSTF